MSESASPPEKDGARCEPGGSRCPTCNAPALDHRAEIPGSGKIFALRDECALFPGGAHFCAKAFDRGVQYTAGATAAFEGIGVDLGYDPPVVAALPDPPCWPCYNGEPHERGAACVKAKS